MKPITVTFVLTGPNAGRTMELRKGDLSFINGRMRYTGQPDVVSFVANRLGFYGAFMMGSPELEAALAAGLVTQEQVNGHVHAEIATDRAGMETIQSRVRSLGSSPAGQDAAQRSGPVEGLRGAVHQEVPVGDGLGAAGNGKDERLVAAIRRLDPTDDKLWTADGKPLVDAVASIFGQGVGRAQIEAAMPGFTRDVAAL